MKSCLEEKQGAGTKEQPSGSDRRVFNQHFIGGVETTESAGKLVKISAQEVGAKLRGGAVQNRGQPQ